MIACAKFAYICMQKPNFLGDGNAYEEDNPNAGIDWDQVVLLSPKLDSKAFDDSILPTSSSRRESPLRPPINHSTTEVGCADPTVV